MTIIVATFQIVAFAFGLRRPPTVVRFLSFFIRFHFFINIIFFAVIFVGVVVVVAFDAVLYKTHATYANGLAAVWLQFILFLLFLLLLLLLLFRRFFIEN